MPHVISDRTRSVSADRTQGQALRVVPIVGPSTDQPPYELLRPETLGQVKVTEIDAAGHVPELRVSNALDVRVFLMHGQELIGAKQNRILNTDVMVPAKSEVIIPVSCVEQGRWRPISAAFSMGKSSSHRTRSGSSARVYDALKRRGKHDADQGAVWNEVAACIQMSEAVSPTHALSDAYAKREGEFREFRKSLRLPEEAVGLAVLHDGTLHGLDLFDRHSTLLNFWETLLDSYAIDFLSAPIDPSQPQQSEEGAMIREALDVAAAGKWESFKSPGEGEDWRLEDERLTGAALVWGGQTVVHLQLFPKPAAARLPK